MRLEVINTGTEILLGHVINTHLGFIGQELFPLGLRVFRQVCVPDGADIATALRETFGRAEIVLVTGGLGPTSDDITRDVTAELLGRALRTDPAVLETLTAYFQRFGRKLDERTARQAQVPEGAEVLPNPHGSAPGLYLPAVGGKSPHLFLLPGPPRELRPMFAEQVVPRLRTLLPAGEIPADCRTYRVVGLGESMVEERIGPALLAIEGLELGYCARVGEVDVRCIGSEEALERAEAIILPELSGQIFSRQAEELETVIVRLLTERQQKLAVAESCTGGLLANRITDVPGASTVFIAGFTTYAVQSKSALLGVNPELVECFGVYSEEVAAAMAAGARRAVGADYALSTTGIAGLEGGSEQKPAGTVFIALASGPDDAAPTVEKHFFPGDRAMFKRRATQAALDLLRRALVSGRNQVAAPIESAP